MTTLTIRAPGQPRIAPDFGHIVEEGPPTMASTDIKNRPHESEQSSPNPRYRIKRIVQQPIDFFRLTRQISGDELSVNGRPARWTIFDRARAERCRLTCEAADAEAARKHAEQEKAYSLASEITRWTSAKIERGAQAIGWVALAASGVGVSVGAALLARQPDSAFLREAMRPVKPPVTTAADERDGLMIVAAFGVGLLIWGLYGLWNWRRHASAK
jgi:hypothetical protein